jgi:uncharacterized protein YecE (DUF72 family)
MSITDSKISLVVWQFVRLMVFLEEDRKKGKDRKALYQDWQGDWQVMDAELERLREKDFEAFSVLMMEQQVIFESVAEHRVGTLRQVLAEVIVQLEAALNTLKGSARQDVDYEIAELRSLVRSLRTSGSEKKS